MNGLRDYRWLAGRLGLPMGTCYSLVARAQIPHRRISTRIVRFDEEEIERWLSERAVRVAQAPSAELAAAHDELRRRRDARKAARHG